MEGNTPWRAALSKTYTIAIPMAGLGTRMRPHTHSKPKPLIPVAGRTVLDYALAQFTSLPRFHEARFVFIHSPGQREQVEAHMAANHSCIAVEYVLQAVMKGQSDALYLARELLHGPMLMAFSDTLIETDLGFLDGYEGDGIAWVKPVPDPTRFGVAQVNGAGSIDRLIEKPKTKENNLALVGFYYFQRRAGADARDRRTGQARHRPQPRILFGRRAECDDRAGRAL